ncbi:hypothetical protein Back11_08780 [Paenibacillus baekrokdamisoli]|uniref:Uncharacterized protein n=1 Tax=Paenibacillus baekrokdamisoli TaxID=1712516 RepID=A0A3G9J484_9BACL|nr:carbohydrate-binding family 9-like protein [Paenibacillus baekrokdamisoli]MBB3067278.1 hypothetical protein [Paenibacillus baekrokdamisoli]BBH19533.1 hypothetical protein Back11_08780 [Paenibacillus baekrokdamisoli]
MKEMTYICQFIDLVQQEIPWHQIQEVTLRDVSTGSIPRLSTKAKVCWTSEDLYVRFECEDDHVVATMDHHDDPIYLEDVVEIFVDVVGTGREYYEFQLSPRNVVFDAYIHNNLDGFKTVDTSWHAEDMQTSVTVDNDETLRIYEWRIPLHNFKQTPEDGTAWRCNLYRIDDDKEGIRHYSAWSPTGKVDYHIPQRFGTFLFRK